jgi:uncharacterized protein YbcI
MGDYPNTITIKSDGNILKKESVITSGQGNNLKVTGIRYEYVKSITKLGKHLTLSLDELKTMSSKEIAIFDYE